MYLLILALLKFYKIKFGKALRRDLRELFNMSETKWKGYLQKINCKELTFT